ncbi:(2Fe-2S)-binding protein [Aureimonas sp. ME7]|uniref:(2Fe-2S)-binding protein n=1 Tax=Aureimonas sp. ME7 TaxID=2744252 RepID=UPI0015FE6127|nr:(2Fe-2S)-binding protein [Aureimonas sp. ME7]
MFQFHRVAPNAASLFDLTIDGVLVQAQSGDTILVAMLTNGHSLRQSEFGEEARAGFCLMGACQDCWVWTEDGRKLRGCSTSAEPGMRLTRKAPFPVVTTHG